jgi:hypothetical protein
MKSIVSAGSSSLLCTYCQFPTPSWNHQRKENPVVDSGQYLYRPTPAGAIICVYGNNSWCERVKGRAGESEIKLCSGAECAEGEERAQHFVRLWTLKEAYVKAVGRGIGARPGLSAFSVSLHPRSTGTQFMQRMQMVDHLALPACSDYTQVRMRSLKVHIHWRCVMNFSDARMKIYCPFR